MADLRIALRPIRSHRAGMIRRFCAYAVLRNLRIFDPFLVLFLLHDVGLSYLEIGALLGWEKLLSGLLEVPLGVATDRWGRRRALIFSFSLASVAFVIFAALRGIHRIGAALLFVVGGLGLIAGSLALVLLPIFLALAALQNIRRPIFVATLDDVVDPRFRATALSVETQARSWGYAISALLAGALADLHGPGLALLGMGLTLGVAALVRR